MRLILQSILFVYISFSCLSCYKEEVLYTPIFDKTLEISPLLRLNNAPCGFDSQLSLLRVSIKNDTIYNYTPYISFQNYSQIYFNDTLLLQNNAYNNLGTITTSDSYNITIITNSTTKKLILTFTTLPIAIISTPNEIVDEPKTVAYISIYYPTTNKNFTSNIAIEYRGATSLHYPKKSYGFALTRSINTLDRYSAEIHGMRKNTDWILDAMYVDKSRLRNMVSFKLWNQIDSLKRGIQSQLVELFLNYSHQGIYCFNEKLNPESLSLTNKDALLYKGISWLNGGTTFKTNNPYPANYYSWDGWKQIYPDIKHSIKWEALYALKEVAVNYSDDDFKTHISSHINLKSVIDYYIFLNLLSAWDNAGKNTFLLRTHHAEPFSILPWDLDGSWGYYWDGTHIRHTDIINTNLLFNKLIRLNPENYTIKLKNRWLELRNTIITYDTIYALFEKEFQAILSSNCMEIENIKWELDIDINKERDFTYNWIQKRLLFLDNYFLNL